MKKLKKLSVRTLSALLALAMCVGMLNLTTFAAEADTDAGKPSTGWYLVDGKLYLDGKEVSTDDFSYVDGELLYKGAAVDGLGYEVKSSEKDDGTTYTITINGLPVYEYKQIEEATDGTEGTPGTDESVKATKWTLTEDGQLVDGNGEPVDLATANLTDSDGNPLSAEEIQKLAELISSGKLSGFKATEDENGIHIELTYEADCDGVVVIGGTEYKVLNGAIYSEAKGWHIPVGYKLVEIEGVYELQDAYGKTLSDERMTFDENDGQRIPNYVMGPDGSWVDEFADVKISFTVPSGLDWLSWHDDWANIKRPDGKWLTGEMVQFDPATGRPCMDGTQLHSVDPDTDSLTPVAEYKIHELYGVACVKPDCSDIRVYMDANGGLVYTYVTLTGHCYEVEGEAGGSKNISLGQKLDPGTPGTPGSAGKWEWENTRVDSYELELWVPKTPSEPDPGPSPSPDPEPSPSPDPDPDPSPSPDPDPDPSPDPDPEPTPTGGGNPPPPVDDVPEIEIPDPEIPLTEPPEEEIDIPEPDVPLTEFPDEEIEIDEPDVPLSDVPQTGDNSGIWTAMALVSGAGLTWLVLEDKKRKGSAE